MKKCIKLITFMLICVLLATSAGCNIIAKRTITDKDIIGENGRFIYTIVYDKTYDDSKEDCFTAAKEEVEYLRKQIRETFQIRVDCGNDEKYKKSSDDAFEIIVGDINRKAVTTAKELLDDNRANNANDWIITVVGKKVVINSNDDDKLAEAIRYFTSTYCTSYKAFSELVDKHKYINAESYSFEIPEINGFSISEYQIVIPTIRSLLWSRKVNEFNDALKEKTGIELDIIKDGKDVKAKEIVIGDTNRNIQKDVKDNNWEISMKGEKLVISGGNDVALAAAMDELLKLFNLTANKNKSTEIGSKFSLKGVAKNTGSNYYLSWNDEFNGNTLDRTIWQDFVGNGDINEVNCMGGINYKADARDAYVKNGSMHIPAKRLNQIDFQSGQVTTHKTLAVQYGIIEMMVKFPEAPITTALWTGPALGVKDKFGNILDDYLELDIVENFGNNFRVHTNVHTWWWNNLDYNGDKASGHTSLDGSKYASARTYKHTGEKGLDEEYHLYSVEWTPYSMIFAFDGDVYFELDLTTFSAGAQFTRMPYSFAFGASYSAINYGPQQIPDDAPKESAISMDYFRIYQNDIYDNEIHITPCEYVPDVPLDVQLADMERRNNK